MTKYSLNNLEDFFRVLIKDREKKEEEIGEGSPDLKVDISELPDYLKKFAEALGGYGKWSAEMTGVWDSTDLDRFGEGIRLFKDRNETIKFESYYYEGWLDDDINREFGYPPFTGKEIASYCEEVLASDEWALLSSTNTSPLGIIIHGCPHTFGAFNPTQKKIFLVDYGMKIVQFEIHTNQEGFLRRLERIKRFHTAGAIDDWHSYLQIDWSDEMVYEFSTDKISFIRDTVRHDTDYKIRQFLTFRRGETVKYWLQNYPPYWVTGEIQEFMIKSVSGKSGKLFDSNDKPVRDIDGHFLGNLYIAYAVKINDEWILYNQIYKKEYLRTKDDDFIYALEKKEISVIEWDKELKIIER